LENSDLERGAGAGNRGEIMHEGQGEVWARKKEVERRGKVILHWEIKLNSLSACWDKHIFIILKVKVTNK